MGKAFKRPQDLKKHVKTHADDSVIMRSPEPNGGARQPQGMPQVPQTYYAPALPPQDYAGQHHGNPYYQTHPQVQTGQHPGYGPVTYYNAPAPQATYDYETRKRGYDALDAFFGQVKRREFDPMQYQAVSRRLFELQGLQLPQIIPSTLGVPAYQPVSVGGGSYESNDPIQAYSLPPMGNAKTRGDLTSIDQILEQMQATIYENDTHLGSSGVGQAGPGYVAYRTSNSPPGAAQVPTGAAHSNPTALLQHQHQGSIASATDASTPGLTPPSSAQSYTSGQSPLQGHAAPTSSAMYPSLPSNASDTAYAAANSATLSGMFDNDERRRYSGGMLQRAAPAKDKDDMDIVTDGSVTPPASAMNKQAKGKKKAGSPEDSVIDPALFAAEVGTPKSDSKDPEPGEVWVQNMRLIEWMRDLIKKRLDTEQFDDDDKTVTPKAEGGLDHEMTGTDDPKHRSEEEQLYPVLRHVEESA